MARNDSSRKRKKRSKMSGPSAGLIIAIVGTVVGFCFLGCLGLTIIGIPAARHEARKTQSKMNLRQIGLALYNYHDNYGMFPPGDVVREDGVSLGSWQARLLPYIDMAPLYRQISFEEGWESAQNSAVYGEPIATYHNHGLPKPPAASISHYAGNIHTFPSNTGIRIYDIADGASNTIVVGEVTHGLKHWGDPANLRDPAIGLGPTPGQFNGPWRDGGCQFLFADGAAIFISNDIDPAVLEALATPSGGEAVTEF
ncbi:MAG: DUF1559 domain-containing protein [Planctomycetaceae bacterium]